MYYIVDPKMIGRIYDNDDIDIELLQFKTENSAKHYLLKHGYKVNIVNDDDDDNVIKTDSTNDNIIKVFTDGACSNNGKVGAKAGIGVYFGDNDSRNVSKKINGKQTNNTAELSAIIEVFNICKDDIENGKKIMIYSDSTYSIRCCGEYGEKCSKNGYKNKKGFVPNHELVKIAYELFKNNSNVEINYIKAHTGLSDDLSKGNEGADMLANLSIN